MERAEFLAKAISLLGSQQALARASGVPQSTISRALYPPYCITPRVAVLIERATAGQVKRGELRPDIFAEA